MKDKIKTKSQPMSDALRRNMAAFARECEADRQIAQATTPPAGLPATSDDGAGITLNLKPGESRGRGMARLAAAPFVAGAQTLRDFSKHVGLPSAPANDLVAELEAKASNASGGDLTEAEGMLVVQATTLDSIFNAMARHAAASFGKHDDATERYLRMALKAQAQCRTTLETLATIKAGPVVFARQANITTGGQMQVNNGTAPAHSAPARMGETAEGVSPSNELLEASNGQRLDIGAKGEAVGADPQLVPLGQVNRPAH